MNINDFIKLVQHTNPNSTICTKSHIDFSKFNYDRFFSPILWYSYNQNTQQDPWEKTRNVNNTLWIYNPINDIFFKQIIKQIFSFNNNTLLIIDSNQNKPNASVTITNYLNNLNCTDSFLLTTTYRSSNLSIFTSILKHLRNSIAHGAFNIVIKNNNIEYIECYDINQKNNGNFYFQYPKCLFKMIYEKLTQDFSKSTFDFILYSLSISNIYAITKTKKCSNIYYYFYNSILIIKCIYINSDILEKIEHNFFNDFIINDVLLEIKNENLQSFSKLTTIKFLIYSNSRHLNKQEYTEEFLSYISNYINNSPTQIVSTNNFSLYLQHYNISINLYKYIEYDRFAEYTI